MLEVLQATLNVLESKVIVYCEFYGTKSEEVIQLDKEIYALKLKILDAMMEE
jgi:hypothetical protein